MPPSELRREGWLVVGRVLMVEDMIATVEDGEFSLIGNCDKDALLFWLKEVRAEEVKKAGVIYEQYKGQKKQPHTGFPDENLAGQTGLSRA